MTPPHHFQRDHAIPEDQAGRTWCLCGRPRTNAEHKLPETRDELSRRVLGENEKEEGRT